jgi:hypothetical protein
LNSAGVGRASGAILLAFAAFATAGGCSGAVRSPLTVGSDGGTGPSGCTPGLSLPCACPEGELGAQVCNAAGDGYGTCLGCMKVGTGSGTGGGTGPGSGTGSGAGAHHDGGMPGVDAGAPCIFLPTDPVDHDGDGWSALDGDCNDCNKYVNPGAYDIAGDGIDEDCDGTVDDEPTGCDATLAAGPATTTASDGAKAIDLCRTTTDAATLPTKTWGVVLADYVLPDGTTSTSANFALGFGLLGPSFGMSNPTQQGVRMLGLSSGTARQPTDPGYQDVSGFDKGYTHGAPAGFPSQTPACGAITFGQPHDGAALRLVIRVPTNALTLSFDSNLFSYEFPDWVCSPYNDTFLAIMTPSPTGEPASANANVAFDPMGNTIGVNSAFMTVCNTNTQAGASSGVMKSYACPEGPAKLLGTGFGIDTTNNSNGDNENQGSTDWLTTTVSVASLAGQEVTLLFAVWDSSDGVLDTTVLVDNVRWTFASAPDAVPPQAMPPVTVPK